MTKDDLDFGSDIEFPVLIRMMEEKCIVAHAGMETETLRNIAHFSIGLRIPSARSVGNLLSTSRIFQKGE